MRLIHVASAALVATLSATVSLAIETAPAASPPAAAAPAAAPVAAGQFTTANTLIGAVLDNPDTRAVVDKFVPNFSKGERIAQARGMTLKMLQQFAPNMFTDDLLSKIDADFALLAAGVAPAAALPAAPRAAASTGAAAAPQVAGGHFTSADTPIGDLLDNPAARAVLDKHVPLLTHSDQVDMARGMTLKVVQQYSPDQFTDEVLAKIDADLAQLPAGK